MLIIALFFSIVFCAIFCSMSSSEKRYAILNDVCLGIGVIFGILSVVLIVIGGVNAIKVTRISTLEKKIALYEQENEKNANLLDEIVYKYLQREDNEKYRDLIGEDSIIALSLIPDFNVDTHTNWILRSIQNNRTKILECKEKLIDLQHINKLYFFEIIKIRGS